MILVLVSVCGAWAASLGACVALGVTDPVWASLSGTLSMLGVAVLIGLAEGSK